MPQVAASGLATSSTVRVPAAAAVYSGIMKRNAAITISIGVTLVSLCALTVSACTSFAVTSERTLYGMNFDYPPNVIRFSIEDHASGAVFLGEFLMDDFWARTVGMNEHGLFASNQMVYPARATVEEPAPDEVYIWDAFYSGLSECRSVEGALAWIGNRRVVQYPSLQLHNLFADPSGNAVVLECGHTENVITEIEGPFLVMTNYHNGDFRGIPLDEIAGVGAERYQVAYRTIEENLNGFDIDDAFDVLRRSAQSTGDYKTRYSLVFDPAALQVYIALERDYDHIWRASLHDRTIEMYRGFSRQLLLPLGEDGVTGPTLQQLVRAVGPETERVARGVWWPLLVAGAIVLLGVGLFFALGPFWAP